MVLELLKRGTNDGTNTVSSQYHCVDVKDWFNEGFFQKNETKVSFLKLTNMSVSRTRMMNTNMLSKVKLVY